MSQFADLAVAVVTAADDDPRIRTVAVNAVAATIIVEARSGATVTVTALGGGTAAVEHAAARAAGGPRVGSSEIVDADRVVAAVMAILRS